MEYEIQKQFRRLVSQSLNTDQINHLGEMLDSKFNVHKESGIFSKIPIPQQTAADVLTEYFSTDGEIVLLFTLMLRNEGKRFYNTNLRILNRDKFISILQKHKWVYDEELIRFFMDPFYEHEINFLKQIRQLDVREDGKLDDIIKKIEKASKKMSMQDLEWRITVRMYDLDRQIGELLRKIIDMLLVRQNLQKYAFELFTCLKELAINASKANYKILFEKHITKPMGITTKNKYVDFLEMFRDEIEENGNERLFKLAKQEDKFINLIFQSTKNSIEIWVTNNANISLVEKRQIIKRLNEGELQNKNVSTYEDSLTEGAGLGINIILSILKKYSSDKKPLKVVFYPDHIKIGFRLLRENLIVEDKDDNEADDE